MKVSELIKLLQAQPQEFDAVISADNASGDSVTVDADEVTNDPRMGVVYIQGKE